MDSAAPGNSNPDLVSRLQDFLKQESSRIPSTPSINEEKPLSSSYEWSEAGEELTPDVTTPSPASAIQEELKPEGSFYDKMGKYIESKPELSSSFNQWYSENVMGVRQPKSAAPSYQEPTLDPKVIQEQWNQAYQNDPIGTTMEIFNRLIQNQNKNSQEQLQNQLKPILGFVAKTAKMNFESGLQNDGTYKLVKPIFDQIISQVTPDQIQTNPEILNAMYNIAVGQAYREGKLTGKAAASAPPPLNPVPGYMTGPQGKTISNLTKDEKMLLQKYGNDISVDDYMKYGGVE